METSSGKATEHKPYEVLTRLDTEMWAFGSNAGTRTRTHTYNMCGTRGMYVCTHILHAQSLCAVYIFAVCRPLRVGVFVSLFECTL